MFTCVFVLEQKFTYAWGTNSISKGHRSRKALQWHRAYYFVLWYNSCLEKHISRLGCTSSNLGEYSPEVPPSWRRACIADSVEQESEHEVFIELNDFDDCIEKEDADISKN